MTEDIPSLLQVRLIPVQVENRALPKNYFFFALIILDIFVFVLSMQPQTQELIITFII